MLLRPVPAAGITTQVDDDNNGAGGQVDDIMENPQQLPTLYIWVITYVLYVVRQLVVLEPDQLGQLQDETDAALDLNEAPEAGTFRFHIEGSQSDVTFSTGPEYFSRFKAPNPFGSVSTRSNSRRSSINQSNFLPCSRPDLYERFFENGQSVFLPSSGLILRNDLHHAFGRLMLSLYEKDGFLFVHCFLVPYSIFSRWHGKMISPDFFRGDPSRRPDPILLHWHYNQCVKARMRGFSVGML
ncbi:hypothetical protein L204_102264 [Cryptococcus depauperatus]